EKRPGLQAMFVAGQAMMCQTLRGKDDLYAERCLAAAERCWNASRQPLANTVDLAWRLLAALEMATVAGDAYAEHAASLANRLTEQQFKASAFRQNRIVGFFRMWLDKEEPLRDTVHSAMPAYALLRAAKQLRRHPDGDRWSSAVRLYLDGYVIPMVDLSP